MERVEIMDKIRKFKYIHTSILKIFIFTLLAEIFCHCHLVTATEIDSYTHTELLSEDSTDIINREINLLLEQAVLKANQKKVSDPDELCHIINAVVALPW